MSEFKLTKIIEKKKKGEKLTERDINYFIKCVLSSTSSKITKEKCMDRAQLGALLMAIYFNGLDRDEATTLTMQMKNSGYVFTWPEQYQDLVVDKHSTGGVGDKVSLILTPALAAVGLKVPMISGRSLSHTGGTLDKLESIPGFRVLLTKEEIFDMISSIGCCIVGQTEDCVPADKVLYHCREITATVSCPPLIVASIASKKLSEGTSGLVYDVKFGRGSVFSSKKEAIETARNLVELSKGTVASALLTSMESPLGKTIGNSLEVVESIICLQGRGPADVIELTCALGSELLHSVKGTSKAEGSSMILDALKDGTALHTFHKMIIRQGVPPEVAKELCYGNTASVLSEASYETEICYEGEDGYIEDINPLTLAEVWKDELMQSDQHPGVGLTLLKIVGDKIKAGDLWVKVHHQSDQLREETLIKLKNAILVGKALVKRLLIERRFYRHDECLFMENF